ncbi:MAG: hypothetical protein ACRDN1_16880 [Trebonia sp.]
MTLPIVAVSIAAGALAGIVFGAAAPAFATPAPLSGTADALTQSASDPGTWTTTAYLNTAALCAEPVTFALQLTPSPSPGEPVPATPASSVTANCGAGEAASPITAVTLSASLAEVPLSATLVVTPSPVAAASEAQLDVTLAVHRHVSVYQYLVIPACSGAALAVLLIIATVAFGVPRTRRPARPPRSGRRNAHLDKEDFWRRPLYAACAWTWGDSWVTNITAVGTIIGTVLTASSGVAALLPGVDQGRFSLLLALAGGVSVIAPLIFALLNYRFSRQNPATARIMQISLPAGHGGFTVTMPVGGSVAVPSGGTLDSGQALSPGTTLDVPVNGEVMVAAPETGQDDSTILVLPGSNDIVLPPEQRITLRPAISVPPSAIQGAQAARVTEAIRAARPGFASRVKALVPGAATTTTPAPAAPAATTVAALTVPDGAKLSFTGLADITLPSGSRVSAVGEPKNEVTLSEDRTFTLPSAGEVISQLWSLLLASCFTMFGIGADLAIAGWVLGYDLAAAPLWARALIAAVAGAAALIVVWYGVFAIRSLADTRDGSVLSGRRDASFIL